MKIKARSWVKDGADDLDESEKKRKGGHYEKKKVVRFKLWLDREKMS